MAEQTRMDVWCETVTKEIKSLCVPWSPPKKPLTIRSAPCSRAGSALAAPWRAQHGLSQRLADRRVSPDRSDGNKRNPPNQSFKIHQPQKMEPLDLKNPMATRAHGTPPPPHSLITGTRHQLPQTLRLTTVPLCHALARAYREKISQAPLISLTHWLCSLCLRRSP